MDEIELRRRFMKSAPHALWDDHPPDQTKGKTSPPLQQPYPDGADLIELPGADAVALGDGSIAELIENRRSRRAFKVDPITLDELATLLWVTQGVKEAKNLLTLRTVPSGGARHAFETYLSVAAVDGLEPGIYRYLALEHKLLRVGPVDAIREKTCEACHGQNMVRLAAVTFFWTAVPYRSEWRYSVGAAKMLLIDVGHVCQNLYLACEALGLGTCAVAAYDQARCDELIAVDGEEEFTIYAAPVGRVES